MARQDRIVEAIGIVENEHILDISLLAERMNLSYAQAAVYMKRIKGRGIKWVNEVATYDYYWKIKQMLEGLEKDIWDLEELYNSIPPEKYIAKKLVKDSIVEARGRFLDYYSKIGVVHSLKRFLAKSQPKALQQEEMPIEVVTPSKLPWEKVD